MNFGINVGDIFSGIGTLAKDLRTAITGTNPELEGKLNELVLMTDKAQLDVNIEEALHKSIFVAGWRPFIGWICGFGIAYHFVIYHLMVWIIKIFSIEIEPPVLNTEGLMSLVMTMLGMGGLRSFEKIKGVHNKH